MLEILIANFKAIFNQRLRNLENIQRNLYKTFLIVKNTPIDYFYAHVLTFLREKKISMSYCDICVISTFNIMKKFVTIKDFLTFYLFISKKNVLYYTN
jgi:hypothetical protein